MADLKPGEARITHPDPDVDPENKGVVVRAAAVELWERSGWRLAEGDREELPADVERPEGGRLVYIHHPKTGAKEFVPEDTVPGWRGVGWEVIDPDAERAAQYEGKTLDELKEEARKRDLKVSGTKEELLERLSEYDKGGQLPSGATTAVNDTGEPERVEPTNQGSEE